GGGERLRVGGTVVWHVDASNHQVAGDHTVGVQSRPAPWLALGATVNHLFQPLYRHERQPRAYTLAAGVRPIALLPPEASGWGTRPSLTGDFIMPDDGAWRRPRARVGAEFEPLPGVLLRGAVEDHGGVHVGLTLRAPRATLAAHSAYAHGDW